LIVPADLVRKARLLRSLGQHLVQDWDSGGAS